MRLEIRSSGAFIAIALYASIVSLLYAGAILQPAATTCPNTATNVTFPVHSCDCPFQAHDFIRHRSWNWGTEKYLFRPTGWETVCREAPRCCRLQMQVARAQVLADIGNKPEDRRGYLERKRLRMEESENEFGDMECCER